MTTTTETIAREVARMLPVTDVGPFARLSERSVMRQQVWGALMELTYISRGPGIKGKAPYGAVPPEHLAEKAKAIADILLDDN